MSSITPFCPDVNITETTGPGDDHPVTRFTGTLVERIPFRVPFTPSETEYSDGVEELKVILLNTSPIGKAKD